MTETEILKNRTKYLALKGIETFKELPKTEESKIIGKQLLRSITSVAANYRAACRAGSNTEFYAKICIVVEEADETLFWLELLSEAKIITQTLPSLMKEAEEILKIMASSKKTVKARLTVNSQNQ